MRVDTLHRCVVKDVNDIRPDVDRILTVEMPARYVNHAVNLKSLMKRLNDATEPHGVFNEIVRDETIQKPTDIHMTALWLGKSELPENGSMADVRILWHVHPKVKLFEMTTAEWQRRRFFFWGMLMHELVHRAQNYYRPDQSFGKSFRPQTNDRQQKEEQAYLGNYDEIETHSHDAALEFCVWWSNLSFRECIEMATTYSDRRRVMPSYNMFTSAFAETPKHPALKTYKRKLRAWYDIMKKHQDFYNSLHLPQIG